MGATGVTLLCLTTLLVTVACTSQEAQDSTVKLQFEAAFQGVLDFNDHLPYLIIYFYR